MLSTFLMNKVKTSFFMLQAICFFFPVKCLFMSPMHFSVGLLIFSISSYAREISPFSVIRIANIFSSWSLDFVSCFCCCFVLLFPHAELYFHIVKLVNLLWLPDFES